MEKSGETKVEKISEQNKLIEEELEQFKLEKKKIRDYVGKIGGSSDSRKDKFINMIFIILLLLLFVIDFLHMFGINIPISTSFTIILAILLVSLKIIWMIHKQAKVNHFEFWVLNSIEFRLNDLAKTVNRIDKNLEQIKKEKDNG